MLPANFLNEENRLASRISPMRRKPWTIVAGYVCSDSFRADGAGRRSGKGADLSRTILGTVTDATGAAVPGATVTVRNVDTGLLRKTETQGDGATVFPNCQSESTM